VEVNTHELKVTYNYGEKNVAEVIKEVKDKDFVKWEITTTSARKLLLARSGTLYSRFPLDKLRKCVTKGIEEAYGVKLEGFKKYDNLSYETMCCIYNIALLDPGKNVNIGWIYTTTLGIDHGLRTLLEKLEAKDIPRYARQSSRLHH